MSLVSPMNLGTRAFEQYFNEFRYCKLKLRLKESSFINILKFRYSNLARMALQSRVITTTLFMHGVRTKFKGVRVRIQNSNEYFDTNDFRA